MIYRTLGQSGLKVSALTLGTMMFGEQTNTEDSLRIIDKAWDQGINFIDTADVYTGGRSEELVGEAIARQRQDRAISVAVQRHRQQRQDKIRIAAIQAAALHRGHVVKAQHRAHTFGRRGAVFPAEPVQQQREPARAPVPSDLGHRENGVLHQRRQNLQILAAQGLKAQRAGGAVFKACVLGHA